MLGARIAPRDAHFREALKKVRTFWVRKLLIFLFKNLSTQVILIVESLNH